MKLLNKIPVLVLISLLIALTGCKNKKAGSNEEKNKPDTQKIESKAETPLPAQVSDLQSEQALREAALEGNYDKVVQLIGKNVNVNAIDEERRTALMFAAFNGHTNIVQALLDADAKVDMKDLSGRTALLYASTGPFPKTVEILLEYGADPNMIDNEEHFTSLMYAAAEGNMEVVKVLLKNNADPSMTDIDGDNAVVFARQNGYENIAELIEKKMN